MWAAFGLGSLVLTTIGLTLVEFLGGLRPP